MKLSQVPVERGLQVRLMSPLGSYPADTFTHRMSALVVSPEICFSVVRLKGKDWSFSEVDNLTPLEIPLLGSIVPSGDAGDPYIYPYPTQQTFLLETAADEDFEVQSISKCKNFLLERLKQISSQACNAGLSHRPPAMGGAPYRLIASQHSDRERCANYDRLEVAGPVVLRGVSALIKAHMAWRHGECGEAAGIFLWISLDAAYSLILKRLRESGVINPSSKDAARYFEKISGYDTEWEKFFEDDYENRIRAIHPENRFGAEARPQFLAGDFYELNDMLVPLFQSLISDPAFNSGARKLAIE